jgi:hypothetical protein
MIKKNKTHIVPLAGYPASSWTMSKAGTKKYGKLLSDETFSRCTATGEEWCISVPNVGDKPTPMDHFWIKQDRELVGMEREWTFYRECFPVKPTIRFELIQSMTANLLEGANLGEGQAVVALSLLQRDVVDVAHIAVVKAREEASRTHYIRPMEIDYYYLSATLAYAATLSMTFGLKVGIVYPHKRRAAYAWVDEAVKALVHPATGLPLIYKPQSLTEYVGGTSFDYFAV